MSTQFSTTSSYYTEVAPGCHGHATAPIVSTHRTWRAAVMRALKSDRLIARNEETGCSFQIPQQGGDHDQAGRFGAGITPARARFLGILPSI